VFLRYKETYQTPKVLKKPGVMDENRFVSVPTNYVLMPIQGSGAEEYEKISFDEDLGIYTCEDYDQHFNLASIEKSLREQGFRDRSNDYGSYFLALNYVGNELDGHMLELRVDETENYMELDLGTELSNAREIELHHALTEGHIEVMDVQGTVYGADSIPDLVMYELDL